eukprot:5832521-Prymnesium_polylepis.1
MCIRDSHHHHHHHHHHHTHTHTRSRATSGAGCWLGGQGRAAARASDPSACAGRPNLLRADRLRAAPGGGNVAGAQEPGGLIERDASCPARRLR